MSNKITRISIENLIFVNNYVYFQWNTMLYIHLEYKELLKKKNVSDDFLFFYSGRDYKTLVDT